MLKIRFSHTAETDLEEIWRYSLFEWNLDQAEKYISLIEKRIHQLPENPYIGKTRADIKSGYRALQVEKHLVVYRIDGDYIDILGLPHQQMDAKKHLVGDVNHF